MAPRLSHWIGTAAAWLGLSAGSAASAAETIVFQFGEFSRDVSVPSLVAFTETGTVNQDLRSYLKLLDPSARQALRTGLNQTVLVSQQLIPFTSIEQPGSLLAMQHNGTHLSFLNDTSKLPEFVIGPDQPLARQELRGMALAFFDQYVRDQPSAQPLGPPSATSGVLSGSNPLKPLITPSFSRQELNQVDPGLRQFPGAADRAAQLDLALCANCLDLLSARH